MRLVAGAEAPDFTVTSLEGEKVTLSAYRGKKILLTFYRFASCPFCNLRMNMLMHRAAKLEQNGLVMLAFFYSPAENLKKFKTDHNPTFPVIPDPALVTYKQYGVEDGGIMEAMKTMLLNPLTAMKMMLGGGTIDGSAAGLPADFLIDEKGIITTAYYGADFTDHISLDVIEEFSAS